MLWLNAVSWLNSNTWSRLTAVLNGRTVQRRKPKPVQRNRRLTLDPLEERALLSVTPGHVDDQLISQPVEYQTLFDMQYFDQHISNDPYTCPVTLEEFPMLIWQDGNPQTLSAKSLASDHDGNFVATWSQVDTIQQLVIDEETGEVVRDFSGQPVYDVYVADENVYARYFTDEVQRLTLPELSNHLPNGFGRFDIRYGGNEVQRLSITATYQPFTPRPLQWNVAGSFTVWFDANRDDNVTPGETATILFDESLPVVNNVRAIQDALRGMAVDAFGNPNPNHPLYDVEVEGLNPQTYHINFGDASGGLSQPRLVVTSTNFPLGFLPSVQVDKVREPVVIENIPISPTDPFLTANAIENWFAQTSETFPMAPVNFPPPALVPPVGPYSSPLARTTPVPRISVTPVFGLGEGQDLVTFDFTFIRESGKMDHPEMVLVGVRDEYGSDVDLGTVPDHVGVRTLKEPSPVFRVNPEEPDSPFTPRPDKFQQTAPHVAMDADGEFVIAWQGEVPNSENFGSVTDIFARRFSPIGVDIDPGLVDGYYERGIRGIATPEPYMPGDPFTLRANNFTTNRQTSPSVAMDYDGNFVIAWGNEGQDLSFFNGVVAQQFDRDGFRLGTEFNVNIERTSEQYFPYVAIGQDGVFAVTWSHTNDPLRQLFRVDAAVFFGDGSVLLPEFFVGPGGGAAAAFDRANRLVITWQGVFDSDNIGADSLGVRGIMYETLTEAGAVSGRILRSEFRANSASFNPNSATLWPLGQSGAQPAIDADGDLVIMYDGFGPDTSYNTAIPSFWYDEVLSRPENADLLPYFFGMPIDRLFFNSGDVTGEVEEALFLAQYFGATDSQLSRLRAILDSVATLMRGEANGIMFSRFDADPSGTPFDPINILNSDSVANATRDGHNQRYVIALDGDPELEWSNFRLRLFHPARTGFEDVRINVVFDDDGNFDMERTALAINAALRGLTRTGVNWPWEVAGERWFEGPIDVRAVYEDELFYRLDSHWDWVLDPFGAPIGVNLDQVTNDYTDYVFEITFQGEVHETGMGLIAMDGFVVFDEVQTLTFTDLRLGDPDEGGGWFTLSFGGDQSDPIFIPWNATPAQIAGIIRNALIREFDLEGVEVEYIDGTSHEFRIVFAGDTGGVNQPQVTGSPETGTAEDPLRPINGAIIGDTEQQGGLARTDPPLLFGHTIADSGTPQYNASIDMQPDGNFVAAWTQTDLYTNGGGAGTSLHFRTFRETTDTAGPIMTDIYGPDGAWINDDATIYTPLSHLVVTFDEEMLSAGHAQLAWALQRRDELVEAEQPIPPDVQKILDSAINPENYQIFRNGVQMDGAIVKIEFGMNKAANLAGIDPETGDYYIDPLTGDYYNVSPVPVNKWQAVLTLDGNPLTPDVDPLSDGLYEVRFLRPIMASGTDRGRSGLRDKAGNPLGYTGYTAEQFGRDFSRSFIISPDVSDDDDIGNPPDPPIPPDYANGVTYPESGAVAVDGDGDHVIAWTLQINGLDRVVVQLYNANGTPASTAPYFREVTDEPEYADREQRYASVAARPDGDFVVTWTQFDPVLDADGNPVLDPATGEVLTEANVYARMFNANGSDWVDPLTGQVRGTFQVNNYTTNDQMWSNVAMDVDGNFVITWSSYSQEDNNQLGLGWGVYARRFDMFGRPLSPEFQVNYTVAGNQQFSKVAMAGDGRFVIVWQSDQGGVSSNIMAREYGPNGQPVAGHWGGEVRVNSTTNGNQRYPDVGINLAGNKIVVAWSSYGQDGSGEGVYARVFGDGARPEFRVNTSTEGNQMFPTVDMDYRGGFTVGWSGRGDQMGQVDSAGVFYQRFDEASQPVGLERRANIQATGNQRVPNIGTDSNGNFVVVWTGPGTDPGSTSVFRFISRNDRPQQDLTGPIVTEVLRTDGSRVLPAAAFEVAGAGLEQLVVVFNEELSTRLNSDGTHHVSSVQNPDNWGLLRNGSEILGGVWEVTFGLNPATRKYEAVVKFDGNGPSSGAPPLGPGMYSLIATDLITDGVNALDGNYDGVPGTDTSQAGYSGYRIDFVVADGPRYGAEFRVSESTLYEQTFSQSYGVGTAREHSRRSVAGDHDGNFVVVWTSYGQDDPSDPQGAGVYMRLFDKNNNPITVYDEFGNPLTGDIRVNEPITGHQRNASVAMSASGDFVVVWESEDASGNWAIYAQRFDAAGSKLGGEFRVNTENVHSQFNADVAMDMYGNFVVVWTSAEQVVTGFSNIKGQVFDYMGRRVGTEFRVNQTDIPVAIQVPGSHPIRASVAMHGNGQFAVVWEQVIQQTNGVILNTVIYGRLFEADGTPRENDVTGTEGEFRVNVSNVSDSDNGDFTSDPQHYDHQDALDQVGPSDTRRTARNPQIVMDRDGNFFVVWESYQDADVNEDPPQDTGDVGSENEDDWPNSYGIYFRQFSLAGNPRTTNDQNANFVNTMIGAPDSNFAFDQVNPSIAVDADGYLVIVWNGNGATTNPYIPGNPVSAVQHDDAGVFMRRFHARPAGTVVPVAVAQQSRVNLTQAGPQEFPSVVMTPKGDVIIVWSGTGVGDHQGIFARRYVDPTDTAGPLATELRLVDGAGVRVDTTNLLHGNADLSEYAQRNGIFVPQGIDQLVVVFDENLLYYDYADVQAALQQRNQLVAAGQPIPGHLTQMLDSVSNPENWRLERGDGVVLHGAQAQVNMISNITFGFNTATRKWEAVLTFTQPLPRGSFTLTALTPVRDLPETPELEARSGIRDAAGNPLGYSGFQQEGRNVALDFFVEHLGTDPLVGAGRTYPESRAVAVDADGDYVAVWTGADGLAYFRLYDAHGTPAGAATLVTTDAAFASDLQEYVSVASDEDGDFVVTWTNTRGDETDIYAQRFNAAGDAQGNTFRVNTYTTNAQQWSHVAMDGEGNFIITWSSYSQEDNNQLGTGWGVYARRYDLFGQPLAPEFRVNVTTAGNQQNSRVSMAADGSFVVVWQSDQNGVGTDIIARLFSADGQPVAGPLGGEFVVNDLRDGDQRHPDVAMNLDGSKFAVTWSSALLDGQGWGVHANVFDTILQQSINPVRNFSQGVVYDDADDPAIVPGNPLNPADKVREFKLEVSESDIIADLNVTLSLLNAGRARVTLKGPTGQQTVLIENGVWDGGNSANLDGLILDDEAWYTLNQHLYLFDYPRQPDGDLSVFDASNFGGIWTLTIENLGTSDITLQGWSLTVETAQEVIVNTTTVGDQMYSSVAMDRNDGVTVAWSGRGEQAWQEDKSGHGVFYQRFGPTLLKIGKETRANLQTAGNQWMPSIGSDANGNFVIVWTDGNPNTGSTVRSFTSTNSAAMPNTSGPLVTEVWSGDRRLIPGDVFIPDDPGVTHFTVVFDQALSERDLAAGPDSVWNPDNWMLERNGANVPGAVDTVTFGYNLDTRKWEAVLEFSHGPLVPGEYTLTVRDTIHDAYEKDVYTPGQPYAYFGGNPLDGDWDGVPGTNPSATGYSGYNFSFVVADGPQYGAEFRVNENPQYEQHFTPAQGTGTGQEQSTRSVAIDHAGNYVVVWTSYGQREQGDPEDPEMMYEGDVYMRLFDRENNPLTPETRVNQTIVGHQGNATVAMSASGDFVVVWESQDANGNWAIYAQRYTAAGVAVDGEFRVNTENANDQLNPAVAMDIYGNFVVVWVTRGQSFSYFNDIKGQLFDYAGRRVGTEFLVNQENLPGTRLLPGSTEVNPAIAMAPDGTFLVAWDQIVSQANGVVTDSVIVGRLFDRSGNPQDDEFRLDTDAGAGGNVTNRTARNPQIATDRAGNFLVVWESFIQDDDDDDGIGGYDVFYRQVAGIDEDGVPIGFSDQANMAQFDGHQVNPTVAMDADGDFVIAWNGNGAQPHPTGSANPDLWADQDGEGVFLRFFHADGAPVSVQQRVNRTEAGIQHFPSIAMTPEGSAVVVWSGRGVGDRHGIFARRYLDPTDTAGPLAVELRLTDGTRVETNNPGGNQALLPIQPLMVNPTELVVVFSEEVSQAGGETGRDSVLNPDNWELTRNGIPLYGAISSISFGHNDDTNRWEAVLTFNPTVVAPGAAGLPAGQYGLTVFTPSPLVPGSPVDWGHGGIRDMVGNPLAHSGFVQGGQNLSFQFHVAMHGTDEVVGDGRTFLDSRGAVAADADGDHVVVWTAPNAAGIDKVYFRLYNADGSPYGPDRIPVTTDSAFAGDIQRYATVAMDADGDFVVTWTNYRNGEVDVYARRFHASRTPLGAAFRVNTYTDNAQQWSHVAMNMHGDFIITWSSYGQEDGGQLGLGWGVYARRFDSFGTPIGPEFLVNVTTAGHQRHSRAAIDSDGGFVIAWTSDNNGQGEDIMARGYWPDGSPQVELPTGQGHHYGEFIVNADQTGNQTHPDVAMPPDGNSFTVTWTGPDGSGTGVYFRQVLRRTHVTQSFRSRHMAEIYSPGEPIRAMPDRGIWSDYGFIVPLSEDNRPLEDPAGMIKDINVALNVEHQSTEDLTISLVKSPIPLLPSYPVKGDTRTVPWARWFPLPPPGVENLFVVTLVDRRPRDSSGSDFRNTVFDDEAGRGIADGQPPFTGQYTPEQPLSVLEGLPIWGYYYLWIQDHREDSGPVGYLSNWSIDVERAEQMTPADILVNTTTDGNQRASSITMDHQGNFVIAWSGYGDQQFQKEQWEQGIFYQAYSAAGTPRAGMGETRANRNVVGSQAVPSIASDSAGNFIVVWTGQPADAAPSSVYKFMGRDYVSAPHSGAPVVSSVYLPDSGLADDHARLLSGEVRPSLEFVNPATGQSQLVVAFSDELSQRWMDFDGDGIAPFQPGLDSVLNTNNWVLQRDGAEVFDGVISVAMTHTDSDGRWVVNPATRKFEVLITFGGDGTQPLDAGHYVLTVRDTISGTDPRVGHDDVYLGDPVQLDVNVHNNIPFFGGPQLDGDFTGRAGTDIPTEIHQGYHFRFTVTAPPRLDAEFRVNEETRYEQRFVESWGAGYGYEQTTRSVAADHDGNFVVVWTSYGQREPGDRSYPDAMYEGNVYMRLFDKYNNPLTPETRVNQTIAGQQRNATVAMSASGDYVVVWQGERQDAADNSHGIFARIYNSAGDAISEEFQVHTDTPNHQFNPAVAMDDVGNFVIVWATAGQPFSYFNDIRGQVFDYAGNRVGEEFLANSASFPGTAMIPNGGTEVNPAVAMRGTPVTPFDGMAGGDDPPVAFVVTWDLLTSQDDGVVMDSTIIARRFDRFGNVIGGEIVVPAGEEAVTDPEHEALGSVGQADSKRAARNSQVVMTDDGNFIVVWEAFRDNDFEDSSTTDSYGIYYRRFYADGEPEMPRDHQANFVITLPEAAEPHQRVTINQNLFARTQVNPSIGIDADGDYVIVWNGNGAVPHPLDPTQQPAASHDETGVWIRYFHAQDPQQGNVRESVSVQTRVNMTSAGIQEFPSVVVTPKGDVIVVWSGAGVGDRHGIFARRYTESTDTAGPLALELREDNPERTRPAPNDATIYGNPGSVVVVFNEEMWTAGGPTNALSVENPNNWALMQLDGVEIQGAITQVDFSFNTTTRKWEAVVTFNDDLPNGHYILVVRSDVRDRAGNPLARTGLAQQGLEDLPFPPTSPTGGFGFVFRVRNVTPGDPQPGEVDLPVNNNNNLTPEQRVQGFNVEVGNQDQPAVARAANGQYVVVWTTPQLNWVVDPDDPDAPPQPQLGATNIMAQRFGPRGVPLGEPFVVNSLTTGDQADAAVAIDDDGNFVVVWSGPGALLGDNAGIFAQRFDANGNAVGGQFRVNQVTENPQQQPTVAMDANGNFVVAWMSIGQGGGNSTTNVYARLYNRAGAPLSPEILVNTFVTHGQENPHAAMAPDGRFVIVWQSNNQDGSQTGVYGQRFDAAGNKLGAEFRVNTRTSDKQQDAYVAMDENGNFVVVYQDFGQDGSGWGVYARRYLANGNAVDGAEFRVNQHTQGYQYQPAVGIDADGNFTVTWSTIGQDRAHLNDGVQDYGIYARMYNNNWTGPATDWIPPGQTAALGEFRVNANVQGNQVTPDIAVDAHGNYAIVWVGPDAHGTGIYQRPIIVNPAALATTGGGGNTVVIDQIGVWRNGWFNLDVDGDGAWNSAMDRSTRFGGPDHTPIIGDWNGDGTDQIGVYRNGWFSFDMDGDGQWNPAVDQSIRFGGSNATPIIGDWNGDGTDQIGVYRDGWFNLHMAGDGVWDPAVDQSIRFGGSNGTPVIPLIGSWNGAMAMHAESAPPAAQPTPVSITTADLQPVVEEAILRMPIDFEGIAFQVIVADLTGLKLGQTAGNTILIDHNAAGFGWYVDTSDADFLPGGRPGKLVAQPDSEAALRIDLLTVVMHEMYHLAGHGHDDDGLMQPTLKPGVRWLPTDDAAPAALPAEDAAPDMERYGAPTWLDELATSRRRERSNQSLKVRAIDEVLQLDWL